MRLDARSTKTIVIALAILVLASAVAYVSAFAFLRNKTTRVSEKTHQLSQQVDRASQLDSVQALVDDTETEREMIASYFVTEDTAARFIEFLEGLGVGEGTAEISITSVSADLPEPPEEVGVLHVRLAASGAWQEVMRMITRLESGPYAIEIGNLRLVASGASSVQPDALEAPTQGEVSGEAAWTATVELSVLMVADQMLTANEATN